MKTKRSDAVIFWDWRGTLDKLEEPETMRFLSMCHNEGFANILHSSNIREVPRDIRDIFVAICDKMTPSREKVELIKEFDKKYVIIVDDQNMSTLKDLLEGRGLTVKTFTIWEFIKWFDED